jgi:hypothetical protein
MKKNELIKLLALESKKKIIATIAFASLRWLANYFAQYSPSKITVISLILEVGAIFFFILLGNNFFGFLVATLVIFMVIFLAIPSKIPSSTSTSKSYLPTIFTNSVVFTLLQCVLGTQAYLISVKQNAPVLGMLFTSFLVSVSGLFVFRIYNRLRFSKSVNA